MEMRITEGEGGRLGKGRLSMAGLVPARDHRDRLEQHRPSSCRRHRRRNHRRHPSHRGRHHRSRHTHHRDHRNLDDRLLIHRDLTFKKLISSSIEPVDVKNHYNGKNYNVFVDEFVFRVWIHIKKSRPDPSGKMRIRVGL